MNFKGGALYGGDIDHRARRPRRRGRARARAARDEARTSFLNTLETKRDSYYSMRIYTHRSQHLIWTAADLAKLHMYMHMYALKSPLAK